MYKKYEHNSYRILNRNNVIISFIIFSIHVYYFFFSKKSFSFSYNNLNIATPLSKNNKSKIQCTTSFPPVIQYALLICYLYSINTIICKGNSWITGGNNHLKNFFLLQWIRNIATNVASMFTRTCRLSWRHLDCHDVIKICGQLWSQEQPYMKFWTSFPQIYRLQQAKQIRKLTKQIGLACWNRKI